MAQRIVDQTGAPSEEGLAIVRLLSEGHTDDVIARHLGLSKRTYRRRFDKLMGELGATSRFQAGVLAARRGWISDPSASDSSNRSVNTGISEGGTR